MDPSQRGKKHGKGTHVTKIIPHAACQGWIVEVIHDLLLRIGSDEIVNRFLLVKMNHLVHSDSISSKIENI